jgi:hypothetical protein
MKVLGSDDEMNTSDPGTTEFTISGSVEDMIRLIEVTECDRIILKLILILN